MTTDNPTRVAPTMDFPGTHGFVHGHIHKHKDHTHIHGHIHNHDHDNHFEGAADDQCAFDEQCRDILCDELDDCHYNDCEQGEEPSPGLPAPTTVATTREKCQQNICQPQQPNTLLFRDLIDNVRFNVGEEPQKKRRKHDDFELHFPHKCHTDDAATVPEDHHHFHQLCFHTTIPNKDEFAWPQAQPAPAQPTAPVLPLQLELMLDYDFYIQFNNFNNQFCQWDNCAKPILGDTMVNHLVNDHVRTEYPAELLLSQYHCEWTNCNFTDELLQTLISHLDAHRAVEAPPVVDPIPTPLLVPLVSPIPEEKVRITSLKIRPKAPKPPRDPTFTCKWELELGEPCGKSHLLAGDLQNHLIEHIGLGRSEYHCRWIGCDRHHGKVFVQRQKLLRHIYIHTNYKPCKCQVCGLSFATDAMLQQHLRTHLGEKPYVCNVCGKRFAANSSLSIHHRVHTGEKPLVCKFPGCNKRFSELLNLTKHMKVHEKHECEVCGQLFEKKSMLTTHMAEHGIGRNEITI